MSGIVQKPDFHNTRSYMTMYDAIVFNDKVLKKWQPASEVWPFVHGDDILGSWSALGSFYITHFFRRELKLRPYGRLTSYVPTVGLSAVSSYIFQTAVITYNILRRDACPLCITTKASIGQLVFGLCYPLVVAPIVCFHLADKILTYPVPPLTKAPKEVFLLFSKLVQKNPRPLFVIGAVHMLVASFITYQKQVCILKLELDSKKPQEVE